MKKRAYIQIIGHSRDQGSKVSEMVSLMMGTWATGDVRYGYNPDSVEVDILPTYPSALAFELIDRIERLVKDLTGAEDVQVSLEIS